MNFADCKYERELRAVLHTIEVAAAKDRSQGYSNTAFEQEVSIQHLAQITGMSASSLKQWFKNTAGMSIGRYAAYRRTQYAMRALKLPANKNTKDVSQIVGLNEAPALYPLLHRFGIESATTQQYIPMVSGAHLDSHIETLPKQIILTLAYNGNYTDTQTLEFENAYWTKIETIVNKYPGVLQIEGYVGIAIDNFIEGDEESGRFIAGIRCKQLSNDTINEVKFGEVSVVEIPNNSSYKVYSRKGSYDGLISFYNDVFADIFSDATIDLNVAIPLFEQYPNSPSDTAEEELITELWVPISPHPARV